MDEEKYEKWAGLEVLVLVLSRSSLRCLDQ